MIIRVQLSSQNLLNRATRLSRVVFLNCFGHTILVQNHCFLRFLFHSENRSFLLQAFALAGLGGWKLQGIVKPS